MYTSLKRDTDSYRKREYKLKIEQNILDESYILFLQDRPEGESRFRGRGRPPAVSLPPVTEASLDLASNTLEDNRYGGGRLGTGHR